MAWKHQSLSPQQSRTPSVSSHDLQSSELTQAPAVDAPASGNSSAWGNLATVQMLRDTSAPAQAAPASAPRTWGAVDLGGDGDTPDGVESTGAYAQVQMDSQAGLAPSQDVQSAAREGTSGPGTALPHGQAIQESFGHHDLSGVQAHVGGRAAQASAEMGAHAYATGDQVAFKGSPDLHTAAHEAAHVVQQRAGVHLDGGVGRSGDSYERHADRVADLVVSGRSAEPVLDSVSGGGSRDSSAAQGLVQREGEDEVCSEETPACSEGFAAAENFVAEGDKGPQAFDSADTNGWGWFDVGYQPGSGPDGTESVEMRVGINFVDSMEFDGTVATAINGTDASAAVQINNLPAADRAAAVADWMWDAAEHGAWQTKLETLIETKWASGATGHTFFVNEEGWEWVGASVDIDLDVAPLATPQPMGGAPSGDRHIVVDAVKVPEGHGASSAVSPNGTMTLASTDLDVRHDAAFLLGPWEVTFPTGSATLSNAAKAVLDGIVSNLNGDPNHAASNAVNLTITGHASASGAESVNQRISEQRAQAVSDYLGAAGFTNVATRVAGSGAGESGADQSNPTNQADQKAVVEVDGQPGQIVAMHEFGHAFGLDDQYVGAAGRAVGANTDDNANTQRMQDSSGNALPGSITEDSDSLMSIGNNIRPQHYMTFFLALEQVTGVSPWAVGTPEPKEAVQGRCNTEGVCEAPATP